MKDIKELRCEIDKVDHELTELLKKRFEITGQIGEYKARTGMELFCPEREEEKIRALSERYEGEKDSEYIENALRSLMDYAKYQQSNNTYGRKDIFLIGMPGCGKSTIGKILAKRIQREFIDMDRLFSYIYGFSPAFCIEKDGEDEFRRLETLLLTNIRRRKPFFSFNDNSELKNSTCSRIISCGGGIVVKDENRDILKKNSIVIYIKRDISKLAKNGRPLSNSIGVEKLYQQRVLRYESWSDIIVENNEKEIKDCTDTIISELKNSKKSGDFHEDNSSRLRQGGHSHSGAACFGGEYRNGY